jgi:hypothetical protein
LLFYRKTCPDFQHLFGTMPEASANSGEGTGIIPKASANSGEGTGIIPKASANFGDGTGIIPEGSPKSRQPGGIKSRNLFKTNHLPTKTTVMTNKTGLYGRFTL